MKHLKILFLVAILFSSVCFGQETSSQTDLNNKWTRIESENKEFSIVVPSSYSFFLDAEGFRRSNPRTWRDQIEYKNLRSVSAYRNGVAMWLETYDVKDTVKGLEFLTASLADANAEVKDISSENFSGRQIVRSNNASYNANYYFASKTRIYFVGVGARQANNALVAQFLATIRLNGKSPFAANNTVARDNEIPAESETVSLNSLRETPISITTAAEYQESLKKAQTGKTVENPIAPPTPEKPPVELPAKSEPVVILWKPAANYTDTARRKNTQGDVRLRITFKNNGLIGNITIISELNDGLTENAIKAARRIRFLPAEREAKTYSVAKAVEYRFTLY